MDDKGYRNRKEGGTYVLRTGEREDLDRPRRYEAGRELDQVDFTPRRHILERTEISRDHDHNQIRCSRPTHPIVSKPTPSALKEDSDSPTENNAI